MTLSSSGEPHFKVFFSFNSIILLHVGKCIGNANRIPPPQFSLCKIDFFFFSCSFLELVHDLKVDWLSKPVTIIMLSMYRKIYALDIDHFFAFWKGVFVLLCCCIIAISVAYDGLKMAVVLFVAITISSNQSSYRDGPMDESSQIDDCFPSRCDWFSGLHTIICRSRLWFKTSNHICWYFEAGCIVPVMFYIVLL